MTFWVYKCTFSFVIHSKDVYLYKIPNRNMCEYWSMQLDINRRIIYCCTRSPTCNNACFPGVFLAVLIRNGYIEKISRSFFSFYIIYTLQTPTNIFLDGQFISVLCKTLWILRFPNDTHIILRVCAIKSAPKQKGITFPDQSKHK